MYSANLKHVKAENSTVVVLSSTGFLDYGVYRIVGEIQNTGPGWADAEVTATLLDASGNNLGLTYGNPMLSTLPPGGKSPFEAEESASTVASQVKSYTLQLTPSDTNEVPMSLQITSNTLSTMSNGIYQITGQILNTNTTDATNIQVAATFYDSNGKVVDTALGYSNAAASTIAGGTSASFSLSPMDTTQQSKYASYTLVAESNEYLSQPVTSTVTASTAPTSSASTTSTPVTPEFPSLTVIMLLTTTLLACAIVTTAMKRKGNNT